MYIISLNVPNPIFDDVWFRFTFREFVYCLYSFSAKSVNSLVSILSSLIPHVYHYVIGEDEYRLIKVNLDYPIL